MSLFATLRKKGKKLTPLQEKREMKKTTAAAELEDDDTMVNSTSTPNLHKIRPEVKITVADVSSKEYLEGEDVFDEDETSSQHSQTLSRRRIHERNPSSGSGSISNFSSASGSGSCSTLPRKKTPAFNPTAKLRSFVSMMSMNRNLRKEKGFGSSHLDPNEPHDDTVVIQDKTIGKRGSTFYAAGVDHRRNSQSVPNVNSLTLKGSGSSKKPSVKKSHHHRRPHNMEPGVMSSSSSNSTDSGSFRDADAWSRGESPIRLCKTPEEIAKDKVMLQGIKKFNTDPKRGIDFLVLNGIIERTPESVAQYLKDGEGLSKSAVGNYLGDHHEFNLKVLQAFVNLHDFTDVLLVQALRQFLWSFRLPGEGQKIDRMMECFANRYCQLNPQIFKTPDTCYILSYAIIMLNTSLHNVNVKDKPTVEQFIRMNRDIDGGDALNTNFIVSLYNSIQAEPFKMPPEDGNDLMLTFFNPDIEGWLWKQGERYKRWKRRWFILSNNCLYYFKFTTDRVPRGIIPLENIVVRMSNERTGKQFSFSLHKEKQDSRLTDYIKSCKTLSDGQTVPGRHSSYQLATSSQNERERWMNAISQNSSSHSFYSLLAQKKRNLQIMSERGTSSRKSRNVKKSVRKSQIGMPLTRPELAGEKSTIPDSELLHPNKNPHNYFATASAENSSLNGGETSDNDNDNEHEHEHEDTTESDYPECPERRYSEMDDPRVPTVDDESPQLARKFSLPTHHRVSRYESMISPDIRVASSRDGLVGLGLGQDFGLPNETKAEPNDILQITEKLDQTHLGTKNLQKERPTLFIPKYLATEEDDDAVTPMVAAAAAASQNQNAPYRHDSLDNVLFEGNSSVRYFAQLPETTLISPLTEFTVPFPDEDSTPQPQTRTSCPFEFPTEKLEAKKVEMVIPPSDYGIVKEIDFRHDSEFEIREKHSLTQSQSHHHGLVVKRPMIKVKRRRSIDQQIKEIKVKQLSIISGDDNTSAVEVEQNKEPILVKAESFGETECEDLSFSSLNSTLTSQNACDFNQSENNEGEGEVIQAYNSVLINSVRHTDV